MAQEPVSIDMVAEYTSNPGFEVGKRYWHQPSRCYVAFLKNLGAALAAGVGATATTTDVNSGGVRIHGGSASDPTFAGVRAAGATTLQTNSFGWFVVQGPVPMVSAGTATASGPAAFSATAGKPVDAPDTAAGAKGVFGLFQAAASSAAVTVNVKSNVY